MLVNKWAKQHVILMGHVLHKESNLLFFYYRGKMKNFQKMMIEALAVMVVYVAIIVGGIAAVAIIIKHTFF